MYESTKTKLAAIAIAGAAVIAVAGCRGEGGGEDDGAAASDSALTARGFVYFHGMYHLGFSNAALRATVGEDDLLAPSLSNAQLEAPPPARVTDFIGAHDETIVSGYSLGRVPVLRLMSSDAQGMTRVVMVDPTYDVSPLGRGNGGSIARAWLDADASRRFVLVYGDVTKELGGDASYHRELDDHERATLCYVKGDHERFRQADMAAALVAESCADLEARLDSP